MAYTYVLRKRMNQSLEEYVSGNMRFNFIKHPVVDKEQDTINAPTIFEQRIEVDQEAEEKKEIVYCTRSIGCQTLMRESEAQTTPAPFPQDPSKIIVDDSLREILELKDFSYGHGLPVDMYEIELITKAREKRAFNDALPPLSDEASFILRNKFTNEQETREWTQKEKDIEEVNKKRLAILQQFLEKREKESEEKRLEKIDKLKDKKDDEVEAQIIKIGKKRVKTIRNITKLKDKFKQNKGKVGRDIIKDYSSFGSKVYAPLTRDGHNPDRHPFKFELDSFSLTTYEGLNDVETEVSLSQASSLKKITKPTLEKRYSNSLTKLEKVHTKAIDDAFMSIERQERKDIQEKKKKEDEDRKKLEAQKNKKPPEKPIEKNPILEECLLLQRLLRGRKEQIMMQIGKRNRFELIKELKRADKWKEEATEEEMKLVDNYKEKLAEGVIDAIQGDNIAKTLDYLSKELIRMKEEQKINAIVQMAENERRKRHAEEMGRRQAEINLRNKEDLMGKKLIEVNQGTMDSYINSLFTSTVNKVSKKQVIKEIEIKANKLNKIVDKIENKFVNDHVRIRDLVSSFIIPEIERKKNEDKIELEEKRFIERAKVAIGTSLSNAQKDYTGKKDEEFEKINEEKQEKEDDKDEKDIKVEDEKKIDENEVVNEDEQEVKGKKHKRKRGGRHEDDDFEL